MAETIIYLDHAATSPLHPEVLDAMLPWLREGYGNPGSLHRVGQRARHAVAQARAEVAALIGASEQEIVFTSGGTESDNMGIMGVVPAPGDQFVTAPTEHHAVLASIERVSARGNPVALLPVDSEGRVDTAALRETLSKRTALVSLMHGNNETGVLQPVEEVARFCEEAGVPFHCDAVQSVGHIPIDVSQWPVSILSLSAHKLSGPKGVGALFIRKGTSLQSRIVGGGQERGRRAGTENVAGIVGLGKACALAREAMPTSTSRIASLRSRLELGVQERVTDVWVNSGESARLPHIASIGFAGVEGEGILYGLDAEGICVSTGSACTSGIAEPSHVLLAMGQPEARALAAVRFSLGSGTTEADIDRVLNVLPRVVRELRTH